MTNFEKLNRHFFLLHLNFKIRYSNIITEVIDDNRYFSFLEEHLELSPVVFLFGIVLCVIKGVHLYIRGEVP